MRKPADKQSTELIPPDVLAEIGRATFGSHWQEPLAKALKVQSQAVRRWTNDGCPALSLGALRVILESRAAEISRILKVLDEFAAAAED